MRAPSCRAAAAAIAGAALPAAMHTQRRWLDVSRPATLPDASARSTIVSAAHARMPARMISRRSCRSWA